jgi:competence protein ComFC
MSFLDFLFPRRCIICKKLGSFICEDCFANLSFNTKSLCLVCDKQTFDSKTHPKCKTKYTIDACFSAISYNKTARKLIYNFKYKPYLIELKNFLSQLFYESLIQNEEFIRYLTTNNQWIIVPIPLHKTKLKNRGYNQSEILAKELSKKFNFPTRNILERIKNTKTQTGLEKEKRKHNVKGIFKSNFNIKKANLENFILIDDVVTTGSTLLEAAKILKKEGAKNVIGLTLARD